MNNFCQRVVERLKIAGLATSFSIQGCSLEEINALEKFFGVLFPESYRSFLTCVGKQAGKLFTGTDCFYIDLQTLRSVAEALLKENEEDFILPQEAFVFSMHQGYEFLFFLTSMGDDPPVFQYVEGQGPPQIQWPSFTDFLWGSIEQHVVPSA